MFDYALTLDSEETENILFSIVTVLQNLNYYEQMIPYMLKLIEMSPISMPTSMILPMLMRRSKNTISALFII